jgi:hypothetical protein
MRLKKQMYNSNIHNIHKHIIQNIILLIILIIVSTGCENQITNTQLSDKSLNNSHYQNTTVSDKVPKQTEINTKIDDTKSSQVTESKLNKQSSDPLLIITSSNDSNIDTQQVQVNDIDNQQKTVSQTESLRLFYLYSDY